MPAILSHHLFGRELLARSNNRAFITRDTRDAFLLGNQGPDPLFYASLTPRLVAIKTLGSRMHSEHIEDYLRMWREMLNRLRIKDHGYVVLRAYIYGFLCHLVLDRAMHPMVYAYEEAICNAGVDGLIPEHGLFVHSQIEADLDSYFLYQFTGRTIKDYQIPKQLLYGNDATLSSVDTLYKAASRLYYLRVPRGVYFRSIKDMRAAVTLLYSPGGTKRRALGRIERLISPHSLLQAMSHRPEAAFEAWYTNEDRSLKVPTPEGGVCADSAQERFMGALDTAVESIERFSAGDSLYEITKGFDFSGERASSEPAGLKSAEDPNGYKSSKKHSGYKVSIQRGTNA